MENWFHIFLNCVFRIKIKKTMNQCVPLVPTPLIDWIFPLLGHFYLTNWHNFWKKTVGNRSCCSGSIFLVKELPDFYVGNLYCFLYYIVNKRGCKNAINSNTFLSALIILFMLSLSWKIRCGFFTFPNLVASFPCYVNIYGTLWHSRYNTHVAYFMGFKTLSYIISHSQQFEKNQ